MPNCIPDYKTVLVILNIRILEPVLKRKRVLQVGDSKCTDKHNNWQHKYFYWDIHPAPSNSTTNSCTVSMESVPL